MNEKCKNRIEELMDEALYGDLETAKEKLIYVEGMVESLFLSGIVDQVEKSLIQIVLNKIRMSRGILLGSK